MQGTLGVRGRARPHGPICAVVALVGAIASTVAMTAGLGGCVSDGAGTDRRPPVEQSVRPGVNDAYRDPDVAAWVERFEREGREIYDQRAGIVAACRIRPGWRVADVGAGTGLFVPLLADAVGPGGTVFAVDIVPEFLEHIRRAADAAGRRNVVAVLCTERSAELPAASIDLVFTCDTYHHFEYPRSTLTSLYDALRPGGVLVVVDFERVPGRSSDWIMEHVRAGRATVREEIESIGFRLEEEVDLLETNYVLRFRRP